jgi:hypothetical protein
LNPHSIIAIVLTTGGVIGTAASTPSSGGIDYAGIASLIAAVTGLIVAIAGLVRRERQPPKVLIVHDDGQVEEAAEEPKKRRK